MINSIKNRIAMILRKSEKLFRTDMIYLAKGGFWLTLGQIIYGVSSFLLTIALANLLPKELFGNYKYIISIGGLIGVFTLSGMNTAVTRAVAKGFDGELKHSFVVQLKWAYLPVIIAVSTSIYYLFNHNNLLALSLIIIGILVPLTNAANTYSAFLIGKKDFRKHFIYSSTTNVIISALLFIAILISHKVIFLISIYFISSALFTLYFYIRTVKSHVNNSIIDRDTISYGKHLTLINALGTIAFYIDKLVIFHFFGANSLAIYSIATSPVEHIRNFFKNIGTLALPRFSSQPHIAIKKAMLGKMIRLGLVAFMIVLSYILFAPLVFKFIFPLYTESVIYSQIYSMTILVAVAILPYTALQSQLAKKQLYIYNIIGPTVQIVLVALLTYQYGLFGTILSRVISYFFNTGLVYIIFISQDGKSKMSS